MVIAIGCHGNTATSLQRGNSEAGKVQRTSTPQNSLQATSIGSAVYKSRTVMLGDKRIGVGKTDYCVNNSSPYKLYHMSCHVSCSNPISVHINLPEKRTSKLTRTQFPSPVKICSPKYTPWRSVGSLFTHPPTRTVSSSSISRWLLRPTCNPAFASAADP